MPRVDHYIDLAKTYYKQTTDCENGRFRSWEHCYFQFMVARNTGNKDYNYLSLHLAFFLASWGMTRNSFLQERDYRIHIPVVIELLKPKYNPLAGIECRDYLTPENQDLLDDVKKFLNDYYGTVRSWVWKESSNGNVSETLITKILLGTLGCVPAYDRYFKEAVRSENITTGNFNTASIVKLAEFYEGNSAQFEDARVRMKIHNMLQYPQMKLLDMCFWMVGLDYEEKKKAEKAQQRKL